MNRIETNHGLDKADFALTSRYCQAAREIFKTQLEEVKEEANKTGTCEVRFLYYFLRNMDAI